MAIKDDHDFDNYFGNLLSKENEEHRLFLLNCRRMLLSGKQPRSNVKGKSPSSAQSPPAQRSNGGGGAAKKQGKYISMYNSEGKLLGDTVLLKGRRICDCQASEHKLINNCMGCGRIVCEQEGSGPCLFCGEPVYTNEAEQQMAKLKNANPKTQTKAQKKQQQQQQTVKDAAALQQALAQRDRLLEYDKNSEKRTTVIDDELDYFQENSVWLTDAEREKYEQLKSEMQELKHGSRLNRKIRVDFAGRELPDESVITHDYEQQVIRQLAAVSKAASAGGVISLTGHSAMGLGPNLDVAKPPVYRPSKEQKEWPAQPKHDGLERVYNRVQDKELLEMQDMRQCLSMHQPWASLLVAGIKKCVLSKVPMDQSELICINFFAGTRDACGTASIAGVCGLPRPPRSRMPKTLLIWNSSIASSIMVDCSSPEIGHQILMRLPVLDNDINFPTHYPTSSLLGCVHVDSCLPQEEYRELYPQGESDSPYVFVCTKPEQLPLLLPVQGEHKICKYSGKSILQFQLTLILMHLLLPHRRTAAKDAQCCV